MSNALHILDLVLYQKHIHLVTQPQNTPSHTSELWSQTSTRGLIGSCFYIPREMYLPTAIHDYSRQHKRTIYLLKDLCLHEVLGAFYKLTNTVYHLYKLELASRTLTHYF